MSQEVVYDDLDGKEIPDGEIVTIRFGWQGKALTIDLRQENADKFQRAIGKYLAAAHPDRAQPRRTNRARSGGVPDSLDGQQAVIRAWAQDQGIQISSRGRIPKHVVDAWKTSH